MGRTEYKAEGLGVIGFLEVTVVALFHSISADSNKLEFVCIDCITALCLFRSFSLLFFFVFSPSFLCLPFLSQSSVNHFSSC